MEKGTNRAKSVRIKLFFTLCIAIAFVIFILMLLNNFVLERIYVSMLTTRDIHESTKILNYILIVIDFVIIIGSGILSSFISKKFTEPIIELDHIAQKMSNLDFSQKYEIDDTEDEINNLGKSINIMSEKLEKTINQLTVNNTELEKDIE